GCASSPGRRAFSLRRNDPSPIGGRPLCRQNGQTKRCPAQVPEDMAPQLYLITPADADAEQFPARLRAVLDAAEFSAVLVARGSMDDATYARLAATVVTIG